MEIELETSVCRDCKNNYGVLQTTCYLTERSNDLKDILNFKDPIVLHYHRKHITHFRSLCSFLLKTNKAII